MGSASNSEVFTHIVKIFYVNVIISGNFRCKHVLYTLQHILGELDLCCNEIKTNVVPGKLVATEPILGEPEIKFRMEIGNYA